MSDETENQWGTQNTNIGVVALGGSIAVLIVWIIEPIALAHGRPITATVSSAFAVLCIGALAWLLPAKVLKRVKRRTRRESEAPR